MEKKARLKWIFQLKKRVCDWKLENRWKKMILMCAEENQPHNLRNYLKNVGIWHDSNHCRAVPSTLVLPTVLLGGGVSSTYQISAKTIKQMIKWKFEHWPFGWKIFVATPCQKKILGFDLAYYIKNRILTVLSEHFSLQIEKYEAKIVLPRKAKSIFSIGGVSRAFRLRMAKLTIIYCAIRKRRVMY